MKIKGYQKWMLSILCVTILFSCGADELIPAPEVSGIGLENTLVRFEEELASIDTQDVRGSLDVLSEEYPSFYDIYFRNVLPIVSDTEEEFEANLRGFLTDDRIRRLIDTTAQVHADFESRTYPEIERMLRYYKYYFSERQAPNIYTFISEYAYQQFIFPDENGKDGIGIGLDMFLGGTYPYKRIDPTNESFSSYLTRSFDAAHMPKKVADILVDDLVGPPPASRLLDQMIHNGKKLYILRRLLPTTPDSIIHEYTAEQMDWVISNELEMWAFFFDQQLFYETNGAKINKYLNPAPSSPGMPESAPSRTANYIGLQIVEAYMRKSPDTSLDELIALKDAQAIMDKSRYKPKRK